MNAVINPQPPASIHPSQMIPPKKMGVASRRDAANHVDQRPHFARGTPGAGIPQSILPILANSALLMSAEAPIRGSRGYFGPIVTEFLCGVVAG